MQGRLIWLVAKRKKALIISLNAYATRNDKKEKEKPRVIQHKGEITHERT